MPPLTYIHASEAARTTAGGRAVDDGIFTPPTGRKWLKYRDSGARVAGDHKARLCPDKGRRRALWRALLSTQETRFNHYINNLIH